MWRFLAHPLKYIMCKDTENKFSGADWKLKENKIVLPYFSESCVYGSEENESEVIKKE